MSELAKILIVGGLILIVIGLVVWGSSFLPWLGKLPGDISIKKGNFQFYFPIATCIIISAILIALFNLFKK